MSSSRRACLVSILVESLGHGDPRADAVRSRRARVPGVDVTTRSSILSGDISGRYGSDTDGQLASFMSVMRSAP
jgi:hypothetical protein